MAINWTLFRQFVDRHRSFTISSHIRPDADALGSALGLSELLVSLGKDVKIVNPSAAPRYLDFLDPAGRITTFGSTANADDLRSAEAHLVVDTSAWGQLSDVGHVLQTCSQPRAVIDHHVSSDDLGGLEFKDLHSPSTGELIVDFGRFLGATFSPEAATALFAAIATDTGWFRFPAVRPSTLRTAAELMDQGAVPQNIYRNLYERISIARIRLASRVLGRVQLEHEGRLAYTSVALHDFTELNAQSSDSEDLVNETLRIEGTQAAFIAVELLNRQIKVSFRSRNPEIDVAALAETFGGGGHKLASGATLTGPLDAAIARVRTAFDSVFRTTDASTTVD